MANLLKETKDILENNNKSLSDIEWVGRDEGQLPIEDFLTLADIEYDNGYGGTEIACDLVVVGKDWWLERREYDGSECWEFKSFPTKPKQILNENNRRI